MEDREIQVDDHTSSLLAAIAEVEDDPLLIAKAAWLDPAEFRKFLFECGEFQDEDATQLLKAAESLQLATVTGKTVKHYHRGRGDSLLKRLTYEGVSVQRLSPFRMLNFLFLGLGVSLAYGLLGLALLWYLGGKSEAQPFFAAYTTSFKTIVALGLSIGTALIVYRCQKVIPETIENAYTKTQLAETDYFYYKKRFASLRLSIEFSVEFVVVGFIIFLYCQFPLSRRGEVLMIIAACAQYALGVYIFRKLGYAGMMLHSLLGATITRNLFKNRELDAINTYVHVASTLTVIFAYIHMIGYFQGPFLFGSMLGQSIKPFLLIPAIIATPALLIFNFYIRDVLRKVYSQSINVEIKRLQRVLQDEGLSQIEKRSYLIDFEGMSRDELRDSLQPKLSDLPIGITTLIMVLELLLRR